ncbi:hypothetical protein D1610_02360 [Sphingomonas gilva]|uniref:Transmembrane protein n=1 Tax=Sphingomonas gilva TaxID=2305907 RepID=A0A396RQU7_9SPHN|nr:hypothetical protein [Sphingomonas gilva]RHW18994.1 hypothetical protein D1610_02360 [Sphingomonas gilva]
MPTTPAGRRYLKRFVPTMTAYVAALFVSNRVAAVWQPEGAALIALSFLPALPIIGVIIVIGLYLAEESDEYLRHRIVVSMLVGLGLMLSVTTAWGFLEESGVVPHVPAYFAFILWCAGWGAAQCVLALRERVQGDAA